jgi:fructose-specific phosphotransferase system IIC component
MRMRNLNWRWVCSITFAVGLLVALLVLGFRMADNSQETHWNVLAWVLGIPFGWILGVFASPYGSKEKKEFGVYGTLLSGFLSGFVVAKVDRVFESVLTSGALYKSTLLVPLSLFTGSMFQTAILVAVARRYGDSQSKTAT